MFGLGGAIYEYVIEKHKHEPTQKGVEHVVHQSLESRRCVGKAERHDQELKMAMVSAERRLGDVIGVHPHLVVARAQIELGEEASPVKLVEKLIDDRNREFVLGRLGVEGPVSMQKRQELSTLRTSSTGAENGDVLGRMMPWASIAAH